MLFIQSPHNGRFLCMPIFFFCGAFVGFRDQFYHRYFLRVMRVIFGIVDGVMQFFLFIIRNTNRIVEIFGKFFYNKNQIVIFFLYACQRFINIFVCPFRNLAKLAFGNRLNGLFKRNIFYCLFIIKYRNLLTSYSYFAAAPIVNNKLINRNIEFIKKENT